MLAFTGCRRFAAGALMAAVLFSAAPAVAQEKAKLPTPVIAVIDLERVMSESTAAKGVRAARDKYQQQFQAEVTKEETSLRGTEQELVRQRPTMAPDAFAAKAKEFEQQAARFQRGAQEKRRALDASYGQAMSQVQKALVQVTGDLAQEHGANAVMLKSQLFLYDPKMDITAQAVDRLNKKLTAVDFPAPQVGAASAPASAKPAKK